MNWIRNTSTAYDPVIDGFGVWSLKADLGLGGEVTIFPNQIVVVPTGIGAGLIAGRFLMLTNPEPLRGRSGLLMLNSGILTRLEEIDITLINLSSDKFTVKHGDIIARAALGVLAS